MVSFSNPKEQYLSYKDEIDQAVLGVLDSGWYILGEQTRLFEEEFSRFIGATFGIGVGSGTEALHLALKACGVGTGDEVITVSHTAVATISAIELCGAKPVFIDIEKDYFTIDPGKIENGINRKTKAIVPVHIYGQAADLSKIVPLAKEYGLPVIEDCAQAHGATFNGQKLGSMGDIGCFSFYPTKNLGAIGDGGACVTSNKELAEKIRLLREYGWKERYVSYISGWNSRLDEIQSSILRVKLKYLDSDNDRRKSIASIYGNSLKDTGLQLPTVRDGSSHVYHLYVVRSDKRDSLKDYLKSKEINTGIHYPVPVHLQNAYKRVPEAKGSLSATEQIAGEILSIPIYPELSNTDIEATIGAIIEFQNQ